MRRWLMALLLALPALAHGQAIRRGHLINSLLAGGGRLAMHGGSDSLRSSGWCGIIRFEAAYATGPRWSFGARWERLGTEGFGSTELLRVTSFRLLAAYRPVVRERWAVEASLALGPSNLTAALPERIVPITGRAASMSLGLRWYGLVTKSVGLTAEADCGFSARMPLHAFGGGPLLHPGGEAQHVRWRSQGLAVGAFLRF
jgi:hypothetical protein